jgi:hypothetical protein
MITEANIPNLLRCVRNTENARGFLFSQHVHECGSFGCLIGNDAIATFSLTGEWRDVMSQFRSKTGEYGFADWAATEYGVDYYGRALGWLFYEPNLSGNTQEQRLGRLRKFIYYVLHKRELLYDDSGRIRETARRAEGNHMVLRSVKSAVERAATNVNREFSVTQ